ncbi:hypothetical protein [Luteimonas padinae]|uniref:N-acetylmuramoyl-L-alanine amidase n=1 Tax=Luteimonas padinae TaxID=1714359 RepID=A0ABV6SUB7_9GAMM|nr:hypothetical protein [Luteimonas padinae]
MLFVGAATAATFGDWRLATGDWRLATGGWRFAAGGSLQVAAVAAPTGRFPA